jgi:uncharacterized membrane protein YhaH (DUF805 family)
MSTPQGGQQDPYGPNPYSDAGQGDQGRWQGGYGAYPQSGGYDPGAGYGYGPARPSGYLDGGPVGFGDAAREAFRHIFTYRGRASLSAFWWFSLIAAIIYVVASFLSDRSWIIGVIVGIFVIIPMGLTGFALSVRRLHDSGKSGWWWWIGVVPVVGWIVLLVFYLLPGTPGPNRYDRRP